jgi:hypothetical protein
MIVTLFAVFAIGATIVTSAYARPNWLVSGAEIAVGVTEPSTSEGELLLEDMGAGTDVLCSGVLDGLIEREGFDLVEKALDLTGQSEVITCSFILPGSCEPGMAPLVSAIHTPWLTELFEDAAGLILDLILADGSGLPGYLVECLVLGLAFDDECTGETGAEVTNNVGFGDVEAMFSHTDELITAPGNCTVGGEKMGLIGSEDEPSLVLSLVRVNSGLALAVN